MAINLKHLHYFWVVAHAGGVNRAGERLHTTPQTVSSQIKLLEDRLGRQLLRKVGRRLELTDDGRIALGYADQIFGLEQELEGTLRGQRSGARVLELRVGVSDSVAKTMAYRLLEPALQLAEPVRLLCGEGKLPDLIGRLALQRLDLVISDAPLPQRVSVKAFNHALGRSSVSFFATPALAATLRGGFPRCLHGAPLLMPGAGTALRLQLDGWLARQRLRPLVIAEFDDGALMNAFGHEGRGVFMAPTALQSDITKQHGAEVLGHSEELVEEFFAISVERRITHPCVAAITDAARHELLSA